jgi:PhoH-like ATPase
VKAAAASRTKARKAGDAPRKLFVLDTNVLMHDPMCLFRFEEHDIYLALIVLEELDGHKKGVTEVARNVRQTSRTLDALVATVPKQDLADGMPLNATGHTEARGCLFFQTETLNYTLPNTLPQGKADNQILAVVAALQQAHPGREVVLVSKDINMRVKARALGLPAEDYQNDKTLDDDELLYNGALALPGDFWETQGDEIESWNEGAHTFYRVHGPLAQQMLINQFVYFEQPGEPSLYTRVVEIRGDSAVLKTLRDCTHPKQAAWGVTARNREQNFAMNLLLDPEIDFVTLTGTAGTGKTLLALACGLTQVLDERRYTEIIMTRATVSVGEDIGFLPGTEEEKMGPWMGALDDNLEFLTKGGDNSGAGEWGRAATQELVRSRIKIKSMNFMRGRTFLNKYVIIDEAQNLTPKQMKTLITRAGPGTKIICMGNLAQIDTPYLTEGSSGLTAVVDKFKGWPHAGHIMLARGERSRLADFASEVL